MSTVVFLTGDVVIFQHNLSIYTQHILWKDALVQFVIDHEQKVRTYTEISTGICLKIRGT